MKHLPVRHEDIGLVIDEIERLQETVSTRADGGSDQVQKELALFITHYGPLIIDLLDELHHLRDKSGGGLGFKNSFRTMLEGYSDHSAAEALSRALEKAGCLFSEHHDISVTLQGLAALPQGGHRAVVEVHISPLTLRHHPHLQGPDVELKRIHDHDYDQDRKYEEEHIKHLVFDHLVSTTGGRQPDVPNYFLININDSYLLNHLIEKEFFQAGHNKALLPEEPNPAPAQILVRVRHPHPVPAPAPQ